MNAFRNRTLKTLSLEPFCLICCDHARFLLEYIYLRIGKYLKAQTNPHIFQISYFVSNFIFCIQFYILYTCKITTATG